MIIYFDMDGVLAKWQEASIEETFEKDFFLNLKPDNKMIAVLKELHEGGYKVKILTAYYKETDARQEKKEWLKKYGLENIEAIFVPYGENKFDYVRKEDVNVLVDDFSKNLHKWRENGGIGFKYYNGVNGNHGTWHGYRVDHELSAPEMATVIRSISEDEKRKRTA